MDLYLDICSARSFKEVCESNSLDAVRAEVEDQSDWVAELPLKGFYFGNVCCERLLPSARAVEAALRFARDNELVPVCVTPPLPQSELERLASTLDHLDDLAGELELRVEVEVNDWGVLSYVAGRCPSLFPILGRLLQFVDSDRRVNMTRHRDFRSLIGEYQQSALTMAEYRELLHSLRVARVELEALPQGWRMPVAELGFGASIHLPYVLQSLSRRCIIASLGKEDLHRKFRMGSSCNKECLRYHGLYQIERGELLEYSQVGRGLFYSVDDLRHETISRNYLDPTGADRVVFTSSLPM